MGVYSYIVCLGYEMKYHYIIILLILIAQHGPIITIAQSHTVTHTTWTWLSIQHNKAWHNHVDWVRAHKHCPAIFCTHSWLGHHHSGLITHPYGQPVCVHAQMKCLNIKLYLGAAFSGWVMWFNLALAMICLIIIVSGQADSSCMVLWLVLGGTCAVGWPAYGLVCTKALKAQKRNGWVYEVIKVKAGLGLGWAACGQYLLGC